jgi:hypothetical protein
LRVWREELLSLISSKRFTPSKLNVKRHLVLTAINGKMLVGRPKISGLPAGLEDMNYVFGGTHFV